jgi:hypothetical protein
VKSVNVLLSSARTDAEEVTFSAPRVLVDGVLRRYIDAGRFTGTVV